MMHPDRIATYPSLAVATAMVRTARMERICTGTGHADSTGGIMGLLRRGEITPKQAAELYDFFTRHLGDEEGRE